MALVVDFLSSSPWVGMLTAPNPGPKTLSGTHTYLVGRPDTYVIDPGPADAAYQQAIADWLRDERMRVAAILLTHGHPDHAPGAALLKEMVAAPVWASGDMPEVQRKQAAVDYSYVEGQEFTVKENMLHILPAPGHSEDSVVIWLKDDGILFSGDTILGAGTTLIAPPEGSMSRYMHTLRSLRALDDEYELTLIAPGHGPLIHDPIAKIEEYIAHRKQREGQVLKALKAGPATIPELVTRIYTDVDPSLHALAAGSVDAQLQKLVEEHCVERAGDVYSLGSGSNTR